MANVFQETHYPRYQNEGYAYLATLPEVKRFLDAEIFEVITLTREHILADFLGSVMLEFDATAPTLPPLPGGELIRQGLVKRHNLIGLREIKSGVQQAIGFFGNRLQIVLNIRRQAATSDTG